MGGPVEIIPLPFLEDPFSALSHLAAAGLFLGLSRRLVPLGRGDAARGMALWTYSVACVALFATSGVMHMLPDGGVAGRMMNRLDHGAIFVMIAGTFTGVHGSMFRGWFRRGPLTAVWGVTGAAVALKTIYFDGFPEWLGLTLYLVLGWGVALTAIPLYRLLGGGRLVPLLCGGVLYSAGGVVEWAGRFRVIPGIVHAHEVWHLMVIGGALLHWWFVWRIATDLRCGKEVVA